MSRLSSRRNRIAHTLVLALLGICLSLCGCKNPEKIWSVEVKSPDGKMIATAEAFANGGFGVSGAPATFVYLNWATGSQKPKEILDLANESDTPVGVSVGIRWLSPSKLEVTYHKGNQEIEFQAVKFLNVEIGVTDVSPSSPNTR